MERLTTETEGAGAFKAVVDGWLFEIGEEVTRRGLAEDDPAFTAAVADSASKTSSPRSPHRTPRSAVLRAYHRSMEAGDFASAQGLLAWLAGQPHVDRTITAKAGVKGAVDGQAALTFLRGLLLLLRQSGHAGVVVVLDGRPRRSSAWQARRARRRSMRCGSSWTCSPRATSRGSTSW